jgi:hypothetical protein
LESLADKLEFAVAQAKETYVLVRIEEAGKARLSKANEHAVWRFLRELCAIKGHELSLHRIVIRTPKPVEADACDYSCGNEKEKPGAQEV